MKKLIFAVTCLSLLLFNNSCKKDFLERVPTTSVAESDIFGTVTGVNTVLEGIHRLTYKFYGSHDRFGQEAVNLVVDLMGEDLYQTERGYGWFVTWYQYLDNRNINSANLEWVWSYYYDIIDNANAILANIDKASDVALYTARVNNIKGQALTYRAYSLYEMVQLYADRYVPGGSNTHLGIPLPLVPTQEGLPRSTVAEVYAQINTDLDAAIAAFGAATGVARTSKMEININVAKGMKARVALTMGQYAIAETMAKEARTGFTLTTAYDKGFRDVNDPEWLWGADVINEQQTSYA
jgi:starch-binding outer membrane protein, SusD/RagB family